MKKLRDGGSICICGGGNVAHAMAAMAAQKGVTVKLLTRQPERWSKTQICHSPTDTFTVDLAEISNDPAIVSGCSYVFLVVPAFAIEDIYNRIVPFLSKEQRVIPVPGCAKVSDWATTKLWNRATLMVLHKVPFISRSIRYGQEVAAKGGRAVNKLWVADTELFKEAAEDLTFLFDASIKPLHTPLAFTLTNSNPLLHPSRLMSMFRNYRQGVTYERNFLFYEEWDDDASTYYLAADEELAAVCRTYPEVVFGEDYTPVRDYYESADATSLTRKLRSITAFKGIQSPMLQLKDGSWVPDLQSRYFTEDILQGTEAIVSLANKKGISTPTLNSFINWYRGLLTEDVTL